MLTEEEIRRALHASRVVETDVKNPHGPLGLEHLAAAVAQRTSSQSSEARVRREIDLPADTWERLNQLAAKTSEAGSVPVRPSALAATIIEQFLASTHG